MDLFSSMLLVLSIIIVSTLTAYFLQKGSHFPDTTSEKDILKELEEPEDINVSITPKGDITFKEQAKEAADTIKPVEAAKPKKKRKYYPKKKKTQE